MRFQQFEVDQTGAPHKVGEESVLFASWVDFGAAQTIADLGTGTGILALIAAQRSQAQVLGVELDLQAHACAERNFGASPFKNRLRAVQGDVTTLSAFSVDHLLCNPPYYSGQVLSPDPRRNSARQDSGFAGWLRALAVWRTPSTRLSVIWPVERRGVLMHLALEYGWFREREALVCASAHKEGHRILVTFGQHARTGVELEKIVVRTGAGDYHPNFKRYTQEVYLK